jgi:RNA polymerase sigma-70 factor (ECF subfamily)
VEATPVPETIEQVFRRESGRLISVLTRLLGPQNLELAEDVLQDAFVSAVREWSANGIPDNPPAWLLTAARRRAIDAIRRERTRRTFAADLAKFLDSEWTLAITVDDAFGEQWMRDDQLRMIFMCCHPTLSAESRLTVILKTLCGLSVPAIARALLTTEATINKRLYRARAALRGVQFELPSAAELPAARDTVHTALYLLFNEGYMSTAETPILRDLCRDAMLMAQLLADEPSIVSSDTLALLSLMCFNVARLDSRLDAEDNLIPLDEQDRRLWDRSMIRRGFGYLVLSSEMDEVAASRYHLEAAIASRHCQAATFDETDWASICNLYDRLIDVAPGPMVALNRAVAVSFRDGPEAAIPLVEAVHQSGVLGNSHVIAAVMANLHARAGHVHRARLFLEDALERAGTPHERALIGRQIERALRLESN